MNTQASGDRRGRAGRLLRFALLGVAGLVLLAVASPRQTSMAPPSTTSLVVTARSLAAGTVIHRADISVVSTSGDEVSGMMRRPADVVGRVTRVPLGGGVPLTEAVVGGNGQAAVGHRTVTVLADDGHMTPNLMAGDGVDVVVAIQGGPTGDAVAVAATARVVDVGAAQSGTAGNQPAHPVTLDCDELAVMRILWASSFAKSMTLISHPDNAGAMPGRVDSAIPVP